MRHIVSTISSLVLLCFGLFGAGYIVYGYQIPCVTPLSYALTKTDERFGISDTEIKADLTKAAAAWNSALGKNLLVESGAPTLPVLFVYGQLQQSIDTIGTLNSDIESLKAQMNTLGAEYSAKKKAFDEANAKRQATQAMADELNSIATRYNALVKQVNADVAKENHSLPAADETKEGLYVHDQAGSRIYIYAFDDKKDLLSVLMHEFGHALGLNHVDDKTSVMYATDESKATTLSGADLAELARACGEAKNSVQGKIYLTTKPFLTFFAPYYVQINHALAK